MAVVTIMKLSEQCKRRLDGGNTAVASKVHINELKVACGQVANQLLKVEYFNTNIPMGEMIPNGAMLGLYENIAVTTWNSVAQATLPIKPMKLPRNIGVYSVFKQDDPTCEYIPLQMGQKNLLASQRLINDLMGQTGYEVFGDQIVFTRDITAISPAVTEVSIRLIILDLTLYDDFDMLPILPEMEFQIVNEVVKLYGGEPVADRLVDSSIKEQANIPVQKQFQT